MAGGEPTGRALGPDIERAVAAATGAPFAISAWRAVGGGCINSCYVAEGGGRAYFIKVNGPDRAEMFAAEAEGLADIARTRAVRVPRPVCHGANARASWLVLERIELEPPTTRGMVALGRGLARLHRVTAPRYGWHRDNTLGSTSQPNGWADDWTTFWRERRLRPQLTLARAKGGHARLAALGERLIAALPALLAGHRPPASLLHGDLWSGNAAMVAGGEPVLFDPAVYYGDRETDLAMTELFGGFPADFYDAYRAEYPLDPGYDARRPFYNLYHLLNHHHLFGGGYGAQAERVMKTLLERATG